jgi:hypothetical protein
MTEAFFKDQLREFLNEQEVSWEESDDAFILVQKAKTKDYSFSDEMIEDFGDMINWEPSRATGCAPEVVIFLLLLGILCLF